MDFSIYMDDITSIECNTTSGGDHYRLWIRNKGGYCWEISFTKAQFEMLKVAMQKKTIEKVMRDKRLSALDIFKVKGKNKQYKTFYFKK